MRESHFRSIHKEREEVFSATKNLITQCASWQAKNAALAATLDGAKKSLANVEQEIGNARSAGEQLFAQLSETNDHLEQESRQLEMQAAQRQSLSESIQDLRQQLSVTNIYTLFLHLIRLKPQQRRPLVSIIYVIPSNCNLRCFTYKYRELVQSIIHSFAINTCLLRSTRYWQCIP